MPPSREERALTAAGSEGSTDASRMHGTLADFTRNPFRDLPDDWVATEQIVPGSLLDVGSAATWFAMIDAVRERSLATYQIPLEQRSAVTSAALGTPLLLFSSYNYLGLNGHPQIDRAAGEAIDRYGTTAGGVRMLTGTLELHLELEDELAHFLGQPAAVTFASGYDANIAAITTLLGAGDLALLDREAHRSLYDAARMAGCEVQRFRHNDVEHLDQHLSVAHANGSRRIVVIVDGVYSMMGDEAPLRELVEIKQRYGAFLLVDESHSLGTVGDTGRGMCDGHGVDPLAIDVVTGSLGKAIPSGGGFVAGSKALRRFMQFGSSPYFFSASLTPPNAAAILESLRVIRDEPERVTAMHANADRLRAGLRELGLDTGASTTPIVPVILGDTWRAFAWARSMLDHGIAVSAVPPPAVPEGQSRLRLCATSTHLPEHLARLFAGLQACQQAEG